MVQRLGLRSGQHPDPDGLSDVSRAGADATAGIDLLAVRPEFVVCRYADLQSVERADADPDAAHSAAMAGPELPLRPHRQLQLRERVRPGLLRTRDRPERHPAQAGMGMEGVEEWRLGDGISDPIDYIKAFYGVDNLDHIDFGAMSFAFKSWFCYYNKDYCKAMRDAQWEATWKGMLGTPPSTGASTPSRAWPTATAAAVGGAVPKPW